MSDLSVVSLCDRLASFALVTSINTVTLVQFLSSSLYHRVLCLSLVYFLRCSFSYHSVPENAIASNPGALFPIVVCCGMVPDSPTGWVFCQRVFASPHPRPLLLALSQTSHVLALSDLLILSLSLSPYRYIHP